MNSLKKKGHKGTKRIRFGIGLLLLLAFISACFFYTVFLRSATSFEKESVSLLIPTRKANKKFVKELVSDHVTSVQFTTFLAMAEWTGYWKNIRPGKYVIKKNASIFNIFRKLYGGHQTPVTLTINKFRTKRDFASYAGEKLEFGTNELLRFISSSDSLDQFDVTPTTMMTLVIPDTYEFYWNTTPRAFLEKLKKESNKFWNDSRLESAQELGLSKEEVYTLASIVEEETNDDGEKPLIASVYLNRMKKGMPLGADPTVKFAFGDFSLKRITLKHINGTAGSPYNTYKNKGLPPGPICTPSVESIDAVLEQEQTTYLFFCAKSDFSGRHSFASTEDEHFENARRYRKALDSLNIH